MTTSEAPKAEPQGSALSLLPSGHPDWWLPRTFEQATKMATLLAASNLVPKNFQGKAGDCLVAMQFGAQLGISTLSALQNIAVINGRPSLWGDAALAVVRAHPEFEDIEETLTTSGDPVATCTVKRRDQTPVTRSFSWADAKKAGLASKSGPWQQYPKRMLQMRARAFALRDAFADALCGMAITEEIRDAEFEVREQAAAAAPAEGTAGAPASRTEKLLADLTGRRTEAKAPAAAEPAPAEEPEPGPHTDEVEPREEPDPVDDEDAGGFDPDLDADLAGGER